MTPPSPPWHDLTLGDVLREHARSWPLATACVDGDVRLTWPQLDARVDRLVAVLTRSGLATGDRIAWCGQNSFRLLELLLVAARTGAAVCPLNWRQSAAELAFALDDLDPAVVVWQEAEIGETVRAARALAGDGGTRSRWICHDAPGEGASSEYEQLVAASGADRGPEAAAVESEAVVDPERAVEPEAVVDHPEAVVVDTELPVLFLYTAAFDGTPKAAMLSQRALLLQALVVGRLAEIDASYVYLDCGPLFHMATWFSTLATFAHGGTNVFTPRVDAEELCRLIETERCTGAFLAGPTPKQIRELNRDGRYDLRSLRAPAGSPGWNEMITVDTSPWARRPGGYGQTEVVGLLTFAAFGDGGIGAHGRASPLMQVRIVDPAGADAPVGEVGEICCRGPLLMQGYWNRPEESRHRFRGGWYHTADLGRREVDGSITFVGPATRLIKSAAENVYPAEVEQCLRTHPAVADCAVIGVPDPVWSQSVLAAVVAREGAKVTADELVEHCRARIASYKKPRRVEFVDALPRRGFAVDYDALDARFGGGGYPGEGW